MGHVAEELGLGFHLVVQLLHGLVQLSLQVLAIVDVCTGTVPRSFATAKTAGFNSDQAYQVPTEITSLGAETNLGRIENTSILIPLYRSDSTFHELIQSWRDSMTKVSLRGCSDLAPCNF